MYTLSEVKDFKLEEKEEIIQYFRLGGPLKCTASGTIWCHITCALWLPELKFVDCTKMVEKRKFSFFLSFYFKYFNRNLY